MPTIFTIAKFFFSNHFAIVFTFIYNGAWSSKLLRLVIQGSFGPRAILQLSVSTTLNVSSPTRITETFVTENDNDNDNDDKDIDNDNHSDSDHDK